MILRNSTNYHNPKSHKRGEELFREASCVFQTKDREPRGQHYGSFGMRRKTTRRKEDTKKAFFDATIQCFTTF